MAKDYEEVVGSVISFETLKLFWEEYVKANNIGDSRERSNVIHRQAFMHIARNNVSLPLQRIGRLLGKDHSTVIYACRVHEGNYKYDGDYRMIWDNLNRDLEDYLLGHGIVPNTISSDGNVKDVHFKYLDVSRRLRKKIKEFESYKKTISNELKKIRASKKYIEGLEDRNHKLNQEVKRLKNLL